MMKTSRKLIKTIALIFSFSLFISPALSRSEELPEFTILTEDWFPYQFENEGKLQGIAVDFLVLMLAEVNAKQSRSDIKVYPWARAYRLVNRQEHTMLFSVTRTPEREKKFKWVGPIHEHTTYLIGRKDKHITITDQEDLAKYRIGTIIDDASEMFMLRMGLELKDLHRNTHAIYNIKKLEFDRIDLVVSSWEHFANKAKQFGIDPQLYEKVYMADHSAVFYAFHKNTADWIIARFQNAFDKLKQQKKLDELIIKYKSVSPT